MATQGRVIAHRLYLSVMSVLVVFGAGVIIAITLAKIHDDRVLAEDVRCFEQAKKALPPLPQGASLSEETRGAMGEECHLRFNYVGQPHSSRAWWGMTGEDAGVMAALALLPPFLFWLLALWVRWLVRPSSNP